MLEKLFKEIGLTQEQQETILRRVAELALGNPDEVEIVTKLVNGVMAKDEESSKDSQPRKYSMSNAQLIIDTGSNSVYKDCKWVQIWKDGLIRGLLPNDDVIFTHITRAVVIKKAAPRAEKTTRNQSPVVPPRPPGGWKRSELPQKEG